MFEWLKRFSNIRYAFDGLWFMLKTEINFRMFLAAFFAAVGLALYLGVKPFGLAIILFAFLIFLGAETFNTALEKSLDFFHPERHAQIKIIKDLSSASVLFIGLGAGIVTLTICILQII